MFKYEFLGSQGGRVRHRRPPQAPPLPIGGQEGGTQVK